jgi:hypothetical protein
MVPAGTVLMDSSLFLEDACLAPGAQFGTQTLAGATALLQLSLTATVNAASVRLTRPGMGKPAPATLATSSS